MVPFPKTFIFSNIIDIYPYLNQKAKVENAKEKNIAPMLTFLKTGPNASPFPEYLSDMKLKDIILILILSGL